VELQVIEHRKQQSRKSRAFEFACTFFTVELQVIEHRKQQSRKSTAFEFTCTFFTVELHVNWRMFWPAVRSQTREKHWCITNVFYGNTWHLSTLLWTMSRHTSTTIHVLHSQNYMCTICSWISFFMKKKYPALCRLYCSYLRNNLHCDQKHNSECI
jgi:hypothetical protein